MESEFSVLGKQVREPIEKLDTFKTPDLVGKVTMVSDEVTALCPVTKQPDFYTVAIEYFPRDLCIESKSLKLYLWQFRNKGVFCEALSDQIAHDVYEMTKAFSVRVTITQKPRGGISIESIAEISSPDSRPTNR